MEKAVFLNNQGVCLIERRLYCDAIRMFTKALEQAKKTLCQKDKDEENDSADIEQESNSSIRKQSMTQRLKQPNINSVSLILTCSPMHPGSENSEKIVEGDGRHYIYRKPIHISSSTHMDDPVIILFNLALALHLEAIEKKSEATLERALELYEIGYTLQMQLNGCLTFSQNLGLINNCGQIHKQLCRETKANHLLGHLLSSLMMAVDCGRTKEVEDLDGFILTISHLILKSPATAGAA
jgi:hypothetical protein